MKAIVKSLASLVLAVAVASNISWRASAQTAPATLPAPIQLKATPKTVAWGYYDAAATPVLKIKSGDRVEIQTLLTNSPGGLAALGVPPDQIEQELKDITSIRVKTGGPGGHILTGPIFVEGAEPGDVLEVRTFRRSRSMSPTLTTLFSRAAPDSFPKISRAASRKSCSSTAKKWSPTSPTK